MIFHFKNGESYSLDNKVIALLRTNYYAKKHGIEEETDDWEDLFNESSEQSVIEDWFLNNVNFEEIKDFLVRIKTKEVSLEYLFNNQLFELII
jgi:hypothetical protein